MSKKQYIVDIELKVYTVKVTASNQREAKQKALKRLLAKSINSLIDHKRTDILELP
jgi:hypothetical protein